MVIGVDGMSPDGIQQANTPTLDFLMKNGAFTLKARAVMPTSSSPNWASMIMGAGPEQHGITSNAWTLEEHVLPAAVTNEYGYFPTIFWAIKEVEPESELGAVYHWSGFGRLFEKAIVDYDISPETEYETIKLANAYLKEKRPKYCFIHIDHVDGIGHQLGHGTPAYYQSVERADSLIGQTIALLDSIGMMEKTLVLVTADHGGVGFGHGGETPEEVEIPFMLYGKGIKKGYQIQGLVNTYDNAVTTAFALGIPRPNAWVGRAVKEAFVGFSSPNVLAGSATRLKQPMIHPSGQYHEPAGGLFFDTIAELRIENPNETGIIRYTLDGTVPNGQSPVFEGDTTIKEATVVKAAIFEDSQKRSQTTTAYFRFLSENTENGVSYAVYPIEETGQLPADFSTMKPINSGTTHEFALSQIELPDTNQFAAVFESFLETKQIGDYTFYLSSDDGSKLYVNDKLIVDNDGNHGMVEKSGKILLRPGRHYIKVEWFNGGGDMGLVTMFQGPSMVKQVIPGNLLFLEK